MRIVVVCLGLLFGTASAVFSLPVTFDFSADLNSQYVSNGLTLTVSADSIGAAGGEVTWVNHSGLGVMATGKNDSSKTLDGSGSDDRLIFSFGGDVLLQEVIFTRVGSKDEVVLWVDGTDVFDEFIDASITGSKTAAYNFLPKNFCGSVFSLMAVDSDDSFRIKAITVDAGDNPLPAPEPGTWLLFSVGLLGLWGQQKRLLVDRFS